MPDRKNFLYYLTHLWEEAGFHTDDFPGVSENPAKIIELIKNRISHRDPYLGIPLVEESRAVGVRRQLSIIEPELIKFSQGRTNFDRLYEMQPSKYRDLERFRRGRLGIDQEFAQIPPRMITSADLPPMPSNFWERWNQLTYEAHMAIGGDHEWSPSHVPYGRLLYEERIPKLAELDELMGGRHLREVQGIGPAMYKPIVNPRTGIVERSPAGRYLVDWQEFLKPEVDPRLVWLSRANYQYNVSEIGQLENVADLYRVSGRPVRPETVKRQIELFKEIASKRPTNITVLDVESASLKPEEGIWQIAFQNMRAAADTLPETHDITNPLMQWKGRMPGGKNLQEFLSPQGTEGFVEAVMPLLRAVDQSDYVAGHNLWFDYDMISRGLTRTPAYKNNSEYRRLADSFLKKFYDEGTGQVGNVIDTHFFAAQLYGGRLRLAEELQGTEAAKVFSMQNILLESDLWERVVRAHPELASQLAQEGTHSAGVDVAIERYLWQGMFEEITGSGPGLNMNARLADKGLREAFIRSRAVGPAIGMSDFMEHVDESLVERILRASTGENPTVVFDTERLAALGFSSPAEIVSEGVITKEAFAERGLASAVREIKLTPFEQQILLTSKFSPFEKKLPELKADAGRLAEFRQATGTIWERFKKGFWDRPSINRPISEMGSYAGTWAHFSKGFVSKRGVLDAWAGKFPTDEKFAEFQGYLKARGLPFSEMSLMERHIMATMGQLPLGRDVGETAIRKILGAEVAPIGKWAAHDEIGIVGGRLNIAKIPERVLIEAEQAGVFRTLAGETRTQFEATRRRTGQELYALSPFEYAPGQHEVGLMFKLGEGEQGVRERSALMAFLRERAGQEGYKDVTEDLLRELEPVLRDTGQYGIQVATLANFKNPKAATRLHNVLQQVLGTTDRSNPQAFVGFNPWMEARANEVQTAGLMIAPHLRSAEDLVGFTAHAEEASRLYEQALRHNASIGAFARLAHAKALGEDMRIPTLMRDTYFTARKRAPVIGLGIAALGSTYYLLKKRKEEQFYNESIDYQPTEDEGWYDEYRRDLGTSYIDPISSARPRALNPLDTAGLMRSLDQRKLGHTDMGAQKYGYLFSGGYS